MKDGVTLWRRLSLAGCKPSISPDWFYLNRNYPIWSLSVRSEGITIVWAFVVYEIHRSFETYEYTYIIYIWCHTSCLHTNSLEWHHNGRDGVSNHQPSQCLLNHLFRRRSKKTSKLRVTGLCAGNSPVTGEFPAQRAGNAENISI